MDEIVAILRHSDDLEYDVTHRGQVFRVWGLTGPYANGTPYLLKPKCGRGGCVLLRRLYNEPWLLFGVRLPAHDILIGRFTDAGDKLESVPPNKKRLWSQCGRLTQQEVSHEMSIV